MLLQAVNGASERLSLFEGGVSDEEGFAFVDVKWSEGEGFDTTMISALADMGPAANVTAAIRRPVTTIDATVRAVDEVFFMKVVNVQHATCRMQHAACNLNVRRANMTPCDDCSFYEDAKLPTHPTRPRRLHVPWRSFPALTTRACCAD